MTVRPLRFLLAVLAACAALCGVGQATAGQPSEEEVKAAVAFNLLQFVKWPAAALAPGQPLVLCAPESSGISRLLARYGGTRINDTTLVVKLLNRHLDGLDACQAMFVAAGDPYAVLRASAATQGKPILLIAEGDRAIEQGAGMGVSLAGSHVVLDVDLAALTASGLVVSSKLLRLARTVIR
ncbi:MAG TPA: YfiR family protein [Rhodocyclaceae bacterium]